MLKYVAIKLLILVKVQNYQTTSCNFLINNLYVKVWEIKNQILMTKLHFNKLNLSLMSQFNTIKEDTHLINKQLIICRQT